MSTGLVCEACGIPFAPVLEPKAVDVAPASEYLSVRQLAERIRSRAWLKSTLRAMLHNPIY